MAMSITRWVVCRNERDPFVRLHLHDHPVSDVSPPCLVELDGALVETWTDAVVVEGDDGVEISGSLGSLRARWCARRLGGAQAWELGLELENAGTEPVRVTRMDPMTLQLSELWQVRTFRSAWGEEFRPDVDDTWGDLRLESRSGRSSHGHSPTMVFEREGAALIVAVAWSGNWHLAVEGGRVTGGISPWAFATDVGPGETLCAPSVVVAAESDLDRASAQMQTAIATDWLPRTAASDAVPVEWNHWWPYEDVEVDERVILANAAVAAQIGIEVSTVDAGWFGDADAGSDWQLQRGDWDRVNTQRFPSGLAALGEGIRRAGTAAGIWVEAEALGSVARARTVHADAVAHAAPEWRRDPSYGVMTVSLDPKEPTFLGYVCLGSPQGRAQVAAALERTVTEFGARWLKLDFNIDPDSGCQRTDHGHGAHDGLLRHYEGLYAVLDEFRGQHPEVILEACSSGGLRQDLGLARHVHCFFLSDPDYTEHHLQVLWGASIVLPPVALLHWSWSQWRGDYPPAQLDWERVSAHDFDAMLRSAMLHRFGVSLRLVELRPELRERLELHVRLFRERLAPFVRDGVLHRLTGQPRSRGRGERVPVFQLSHSEASVLAAFRLDAGRDVPPLRPVGIDPAADYRVVDLASDRSWVLAGADLAADGIAVPAGEETSWLLLLERVR